MARVYGPADPREVVVTRRVTPILLLTFVNALGGTLLIPDHGEQHAVVGGRT